jgi:hypothetical protein
MGTEAAQFLFWEYVNGIVVSVYIHFIFLMQLHRLETFKMVFQCTVELKGREKVTGYGKGREGERGRGGGGREVERGLCTKKCDGPQAVNYRWPVFDSEPSKGVRVKTITLLL